MGLRSFRERIFQSCCYEAGGLAVVIPLYAVVMDRSGAESLGLMATLSAVVLLWAPIHNGAFDLIDLRLRGRVASDRPHALRLVHAISFETSTTLVTLPVLVWIGGHGIWEALAVDIGLTLAYTGYAYVFHLIYDRWRPMTAQGQTRYGKDRRAPARRRGRAF